MTVRKAKRGWWAFIKRFINPTPGSRDWYIAYLFGVLFAGSIIAATVIYVWFNPDQLLEK